MGDMSREYRVRTEKFDKKVRFVRSTYRDGSLRLTMYINTFDNQSSHWYEPYADFTAEVNQYITNPYQAYIAPWIGEMIYDWLTIKRLGYTTDEEIVYAGNHFLNQVQFDKKFIDRLTIFDGESLPTELGVKSSTASSEFMEVEY